MRKIIILLTSFFYLQALEIQVNFGKEKGEDFAVLNLMHESPFSCQEQIDAYNVVQSIECVIKQLPTNNFVPTNTAFFQLKTQVINNQFHLFIEPKYKMKLFNTFADLKKTKAIPKERSKESKYWQIIGYIDIIPFLSNKSSNGLNFPINIPSVEDLHLGQLDLNLKPLFYEEGEDFKKLKEIRLLAAQQKEDEVLYEVNNALKSYPDSIFKKDFLFYKIQALPYSSDEDSIATTIILALDWIKAYPTDRLIPEVLYILANAYIKNQANAEANYYYRRIINEYPNTDWMALAKMQLAKNFAPKKLFKVSSNLFIEAYREAKTPQVANQIAVEWGLYNLAQKDTQKAQEIIESILKNDKPYFIRNLQQSSNLLQALASAKLYGLAANIGSYIINTLPPQDEKLEDLTDKVGEWYELSNHEQEALKYNQKFLSTYPDSKAYQKVALRNDRLLFKLDQKLSPEERIKNYDNIIAKYPDTPEQKQAYLFKAQALFELHKYQDILSMREQIADSEILEKTKKELLLQSLQQKDCKKTPLYLIQDISSLTQDQKLALFDCLYQSSHYKQAQEIATIELDKAKEAQEKLPWLYRSSKSLKELGEFVDSRLAGEDTLKLAQALEKPEFYDIIFTLFDDLKQLNLKAEAQKTALFAQTHFAKDIRILKIWDTLMQWAYQNQEFNSVLIYANDILALQKQLKVTDYTPYVDFILIEALSKNNELQKAKEHLALLLQGSLSPQDKQRTLYMQGSLLKAMGEDAQDSFVQCTNIQENTNWKNLCEKSLQLIDKSNKQKEETKED